MKSFFEKNNKKSKILGYVTALTDQADSYVLLAANLEDFRSIARKFVPAKIADRIVNMATNHRQKNDNDYSQESDFSNQEPTYEVHSEAFKKSMPRHNYKQNSAPMTLDEIVERVRERLKSELAQQPQKMVRLSANNGGNPITNQYEYDAPDNIQPEEIVYEEPTYDIITERPTPRMKQTRLVQKRLERNPNVMKPKQIERQRLVAQERLVQNPIRMNPVRFVEKPLAPATAKTIPTLKPNYLKLKPRGQRLVKKEQQIVGNKKLMRRPKPKATTPTTTAVTEMEVPTNDDGLIFEAVDMQKSNDSYEDYVTPPREEPYATDDEEVTTPGTLIITFKNKVINTVPTAATFIIEEPLEEELQEEIYEDEATEITTPAELKARTESLSYEEKEVKLDPNATTTAEVTIKGKGKPKMKIGTMIPTRERFKLSSPNYYAKLPTIAEKYNFNEPIPEQDQEPENLKPIGAPPSNVNGKVILTR